MQKQVSGQNLRESGGLIFILKFLSLLFFSHNLGIRGCFYSHCPQGRVIIVQCRGNEPSQCFVYVNQNRLLCQRTVGGQTVGALDLLEGGWKDAEFVEKREKNKKEVGGRE